MILMVLSTSQILVTYVLTQKNELCVTIIEDILGDLWNVTAGSYSRFAFLINFISYKYTSGESDCVIDFLDPENICSVTKINLLPQLLKKL